MARVDPLSSDVPIVDEFGRPTAQFILQWTKQARKNAEIQSLSTSEAVSIVLDVLGDTAGDILRRGASEWGVLGTSGSSTQFLRADGVYATPPQQTVTEAEINLSDVLTNNVSTARHGFVPKLPNDASQYLDGTGQWSTPAGGGGGGGGDGWTELTAGSDIGSGWKAAQNIKYGDDIAITPGDYLVVRLTCHRNTGQTISLNFSPDGDEAIIAVIQDGDSNFVLYRRDTLGGSDVVISGGSNTLNYSGGHMIEVGLLIGDTGQTHRIRAEASMNRYGKNADVTESQVQFVNAGVVGVYLGLSDPSTVSNIRVEYRLVTGS